MLMGSFVDKDLQNRQPVNVIADMQNIVPNFVDTFNEQIAVVVLVTRRARR